MRVVALLPAATEIVCAVDGLDWLAGVTHECDWPPDVRRLPRVTRSSVSESTVAGDVDRQVRELAHGGEPLFTLDEACIALLHPDLLLTQAVCDVCAVSERDVRSLASRLTPRPVVVTLDATSLEGMFHDVRAVGRALDRIQESDALESDLRRRLHEVHVTLKTARAPRPRVAVIEWTDPVFAAGHWVPEMVYRAGGLDVLSTPGQHSQVRTVDEIRAAMPDILMVAPCGYDLARSEAAANDLLRRSDWAWARSLPVWAIDANAFISRPGPRLVRGVQLLAGILNPSLFPPAPRDECARVS